MNVIRIHLVSLLNRVQSATRRALEFIEKEKMLFTCVRKLANCCLRFQVIHVAITCSLHLMERFEKLVGERWQTQIPHQASLGKHCRVHDVLLRKLQLIDGSEKCCVVKSAQSKRC